MPPICAACACKATRTIALAHTDRQLFAKGAVVVGSILAGDPTVILGGTAKGRAEVPHCEEHDDGAVIFSKDGGVVFGVRSYAFYRGCCERNGLVPMPGVPAK
jgi:hypothetical protein